MKTNHSSRQGQGWSSATIRCRGKTANLSSLYRVCCFNKTQHKQAISCLDIYNKSKCKRVTRKHRIPDRSNFRGKKGANIRVQNPENVPVQELMMGSQMFIISVRIIIYECRTYNMLVFTCVGQGERSGCKHINICCSLSDVTPFSVLITAEAQESRQWPHQQKSWNWITAFFLQPQFLHKHNKDVYHSGDEKWPPCITQVFFPCPSLMDHRTHSCWAITHLRTPPPLLRLWKAISQLQPTK